MNRKTYLLLPLLLLVCQQLWADAGFSIARRKPATHITFEGTANIKGYTLVRLYYGYNDTDWQRRNPQIKTKDTVTDAFTGYIQNGGRHWEESDRYVPFALLDPAGRITDSFTLFMKKYDNHLVITGVKDGKLQYTIKKKKAVFEYGITSYEEGDSSHRTARWMFIICSLAGLVALILLFMKKRKRQLA
jgi:hypothetical protein